MSLFDVIEDTAARGPDRTFLSDRQTVLTYSDALEGARAVAARIDSASAPGRPCIVQGGPIGATIVVLACLSLGKPFILVNPDAPPARLQYYVSDSGADLLVRTPAAAGDGTSAVSDVDLARLSESTDEWVTVDTPDPIGCLIYTSGTTGQPKAVVCPEPAMRFVVEAIGLALAYRAEDVILTALPLFFDFGLYQVLLAGRVGAGVYFASALESGFGLGATLRRTGATILPMVPLAAEKLSTLASRGLASHSVRMITTTGAALDEATRSALRDAWGTGVDLRVMYGLTECKRVAIMPSGESWRRTTASGIALPGTTITIRVPGSDQILPAGEVGEICVEGPHLMAGYHNRPDLTSARYRSTASGRLLRSGDSGYLDSDGFLHCLGREDSQFKVRGFRVSASEVVRTAKRSPGVVSAATVPPGDGHPYALFYEGDATEEQVAHQLASELEPYAVPALVRRMSRLPENANGKIDAHELKEQLRNG
ncbi:Polyketide synthase PksJ [Clavibacter michiganensis]|uniref:Polyketide synthase PksJ n=1 Tax=Clavibacter michiganensis TaxID=28447 RepID=A0A251YEK8_9MICO|nr:class I adenylate-forming enzyme family protein [Clavibacter michiganensis]OUE22646.1 Polyketide synthase PksJ [Clavibacter michiganensis]